MKNDSIFSPYIVEHVLEKGQILGPGENTDQMLNRVVVALTQTESGFPQPSVRQESLSDSLYEMLSTGAFVPSTPILTNAGRYTDKPYSACTVPSIDWGRSWSQIAQQLTQLRLGGMGTGFNFDEFENPIELIVKINALSEELQKSGKQDRPVGNMGLLSVYHPSIIQYIQLKTGGSGFHLPIFNLSVNIDEAFILALNAGETISLINGDRIYAQDIWDHIAQAAWECADPGLIFLDRLNADNPTPLVGEYTSVAPCGEVGLAPGETCQFGSINLGKFIKDGAINYSGLKDAVCDIVRILDNALEESIKHYDARSVYVMNSKRKIGVGVCGFADMLMILGIPYGSEKALEIAKDVMSFMNFHSKLASVALAKERGSFGALFGSAYTEGNSFIERRYKHTPTNTVLESDWDFLRQQIVTHGIRNASTIALPPTGRSAMIFGASQQIEPLFSIYDYDGSINPQISALLSRFSVPEEYHTIIQQQGSLECLQGTEYEACVDLVQTATSIPPQFHLQMVGAFQAFTDESVSKTVNLPNRSGVNDIQNIYTQARDLGLKGVTVYRNGSKIGQPMKLSS